MRLFYLFVVLIIVLGCDPESAFEKSLRIRNNTPEKIYYWRSWTQNHHYPDTALPEIKPSALINAVSGNNTYSESSFSPDWEEIYNQLPEGLFSV